MKITIQDLERIESKIDGNNTTVRGTEKIPSMSITEYIESKDKLNKVLSESDFEFFYNIKIGNLLIYKTKEELEKLHIVTMSFLKALPQSHRSSLLQGKFLSVDLNFLAFLNALIYADKELGFL
ncbi:hypothetical protein [uncultured Winogradskyella sp.]|uniref:hypothetical protein n=1 Tax=uncultured Winogradskyella sp. TaxID=395353 RepID=UPI0026058946|nr:hypothetical protein [uncultured Winogradskyella sp.]